MSYFKIEWAPGLVGKPMQFNSAREAWEFFRKQYTRIKYITLLEEVKEDVPVVGSKYTKHASTCYWKPIASGHIDAPYDLLVDAKHQYEWDCPDSPDGKCHYYTNTNGLVQLYTGDQVAPPSHHDVDEESDDWCIYCGEPEERK